MRNQIFLKTLMPKLRLNRKVKIESQQSKTSILDIFNDILRTVIIKIGQFFVILNFQKCIFDCSQQNFEDIIFLEVNKWILQNFHSKNF